MKYLVVYERARNNYSAYVPDLPGCFATGITRKEVERNIREAMAFHLERLRQAHEPVPEPRAWSELVEVAIV